MANQFLFLAYTFLWLIFVLYLWNLSRHQAQLQKELDELRAKIEGRTPSTSQAP